ncbi:MAG: hypothetical protein HYY22_07765 [Thaumarchaeota archaeon]|nr:hypothetical protein [Nitrososphaerota archaeon]
MPKNKLNNRNPSDLLSNEFKVAAEIYKFNSQGKKIWFNLLATNLKNEMSHTTLMNALSTLKDWGITKAEYGETEKGRAGKLLYISGESTETIKMIYEKFWKNRHV